MNVSIKFDTDPLGSLSENAQRPKSVTDGRTNPANRVGGGQKKYKKQTKSPDFIHF